MENLWTIALAETKLSGVKWKFWIPVTFHFGRKLTLIFGNQSKGNLISICVVDFLCKNFHVIFEIWVHCGKNFVKPIYNSGKIDFTEIANATEITVWKNEKLSPTRNISSNQLFSNWFSKTITFTKFCPKMREREFP